MDDHLHSFIYTLGAFDGLSAASLNNGLSEEDNSTLARTPHIDQAIVLILRGLQNLYNS